jgi:hypothetical protein
MGYSTAIRVKNPAEMALDIVQREYRNYHPLAALAKMAHHPSVICDPKLELEVHKAILPYVSPKLASQEVKLTGLDDRRVVVTLFEDAKLEDGRTAQVQVPMVVEVEDLVPLD